MQRYRKHDINVKDVEPDAELLVWEDWVRIRKLETTKLQHRLIRPTADLAMNSLIKQREEKEWKTVFEHAQIQKKPSVRGTLWEQPDRLQQRCYHDPVYEVQRTRAEMGKPPVMEHVCVPKYIQHKEMGIGQHVAKRPTTDLDAEFMNYKKIREAELREKIAKIDPVKPICGSLVVIGSKPKTPPKKLPLLPSITITEPTTAPGEVLSSVYALKINNTLIFKDIFGQSLTHLEYVKEKFFNESCTTWSYYFNTPVKRAGRCKLFLQNLGTVTLRYCWKKIKKPIPFIPEDIYEQVFFFNKNEDVLSPGQKKEILFTFLSDKPGIYSEFWELSFCNICFFDSLADKISINFYADSVEKISSIKRKNDSLKAKIDKKALTNMIFDILSAVLVEATTVKPQQYTYKKMLLEAEMFVMKNPVCFYHQTEVNEMRRLYNEMAPKEVWDLSIGTWRESMMAKDFDDRMKYYELLRKSHADLLKPWYEGEELIKEKHRAIKLLFGQLADKFDEEYTRLFDLYNPPVELDEETMPTTPKSDIFVMHPAVRNKIQNLFYLYAYENVSIFIELCAGILSSLDLNRWIEFDFCQ